MLERVELDHLTLMSLITQMRLILASKNGIDLKAVEAIRWRLGRLLTSHLAFIRTLVFGPLLHFCSAQDRQAVAEMSARTDALVVAYDRHRKVFEGASINEDLAGYRPGTNALLSDLEKLISDERSTLYPAILQLQGADARYAAEFETYGPEA